MKKYPSIPRRIRDDLPIIAFDKLDGSNIRAEWSPRLGFHRFGTRRAILHEDRHLGEAIQLIREGYAEALAAILAAHWKKNVVCFFEYFGQGSFAGQHIDDEDHQVRLIDVSPYKEGLVPPERFIDLFAPLGIPAVLHRGPADEDLRAAVEASTLPGMSLEGVVCKAANPNRKKTSQPIMFKLKSRRWLQRLREFTAGDDALYQRLL